MTIRQRGELVQPTDTVNLTATFRDQFGFATDTDAFPQITITTPTGLVSVGPTSAGVSKMATGMYSFSYAIGFAGPFGIWVDTWVATINGFRVEASFNFVVTNSDQPGLNTDGYEHLGDVTPFDYSQVEIHNINKLLKTLRAKLNSSGKSKSKDASGNVIYVNCDIYSVDMLVTFIANSLTLFNEVPHFSFITFNDTSFIDQFHDAIVDGAVIWALASQALISRGLEFNISDSGVQFQPPTMSELLNTQFTTLLTHHYEKIKFIKNSLKPYPVGLGSFSISSGPNPAFRRLRLLRARQII